MKDKDADVDMILGSTKESHLSGWQSEFHLSVLVRTFCFGLARGISQAWLVSVLVPLLQGKVS